jgi:Uma2 family endonuclease
MSTSQAAMELSHRMPMLPEDQHEPAAGAGVSSEPVRLFTREEYLACERSAESKHEYFDGQVYAMSGASRRHNLIVVNLVFAIRLQFQGRPCEVYASDMRLRVDSTGSYVYPDVTALCGTPQLEDDQLDTLLNPDVLFEVLSLSTERHDRGRKAAHYRTIPSLQEYVFVSQDQPRIERYQRKAEQEWLLTEVVGMEESIELPAINCVLSLTGVYDKVF